LILNKKVTNLLVDENKKIVGVMADGAEYRADYVILSAGVIGTNQLMLAPVLRASDREKINLGLPVGKGIKDHVNIRINISSDKRIESLNMINGSFSRKVWMLVKHLIGFDTLLIGTGATSSANLDVDGDGVVDTRINLLNFSERGRLGSNGDYFDGNIHGFSFSISSINPLSEGEIELVDGGDCRVRPNYLQNPKDIENINSAIDRCLALLRVSPLSNYVMSIQDEQKILNDREAFLRENSYSGYHLIGGCHRIINENFQVIGVGNLFICDASIFDEFLASNIHTPVVLVADMFSKQFLRLRR
jgi:choline dehydrogenase-like flavoprotein